MTLGFARGNVAACDNTGFSGFRLTVIGRCSNAEPDKANAAAACAAVTNCTYAVPVGWLVTLSFRMVTLTAGPHLQHSMDSITCCGTCSSSTTT